MLVKSLSHISSKAATAEAEITDAAATATPRSLFLKASWENDNGKKVPHHPILDHLLHTHIITRNKIS